MLCFKRAVMCLGGKAVEGSRKLEHHHSIAKFIMQSTEFLEQLGLMLELNKSLGQEWKKNGEKNNQTSGPR